MVFYVVICEGRHEVVAVVIVGLHPKLDALAVARLLSRFEKVLGKKLLLLVKVVARALIAVRCCLQAST